MDRPLNKVITPMLFDILNLLMLMIFLKLFNNRLLNVVVQAHLRIPDL
jgi:hypothetical protein